MSIESMIYDDDDDFHSLSLSTNSDDDIEEVHCHTHRSCGRHASCNGSQHQHTSIISENSIGILDQSKPTKGDIKSIDNRLGHRQKYDGTKWRRICSSPNCSIYLNGGIFFEKWLCRKHYLLSLSTEEIRPTSAKNPETIISTSRKTQKPSVRPLKQKINPKRGDTRINTDGIREKYNGEVWRPVCNYKNCISYIVMHGYCHRHDMEMRKKTSEILSSLDDIPQQPKTSKSSNTPIIPSPIQKPKKGDIHCVRQQWNGTKWYSLCHHHTQDCTRRSAGSKYAYLCDMHYKEYVAKKKETNSNKTNDRVLLSPRVKRKKSTSHELMMLANNNEPYQCQSTIETVTHTERIIQTDLTYPVETNDLRQGCFLIEDDNDEQYRCDSPELMIHIKKEEDNPFSNNRKVAIDMNSLAFNCKLEITKLEL